MLREGQLLDTVVISSILRDKWYGLLVSQLFNSKKSNLVLCVFYPNSEVPWLGPIPYLGTKQPTTTVMADPRVAPQPSQTGDLFPVGPPRPPSFNSPANLLWAKETVLQVSTYTYTSLYHVRYMAMVGGDQSLISLGHS